MCLIYVSDSNKKNLQTGTKNQDRSFIANGSFEISPAFCIFRTQKNYFIIHFLFFYYLFIYLFFYFFMFLDLILFFKLPFIF